MTLLQHYKTLPERLNKAGAGSWASDLPEQLETAFCSGKNSNLPDWINTLAALPQVKHTGLFDHAGHLKLGAESSTEPEKLESLLRQFHPWRKGPLQIDNIFIDTEWRSDWKWDRLKNHIAALDERSVLDIGCGNGYHCWRMYQAGAKFVVGVDPTLLFVMQFLVTKHFAGEQLPVWVLPLGIEHLPDNAPVFETVFSMGVLYHRRSPIDHLYELLRLMRPGGELVLETLVVEGGEGYALLPPGRYAQMRNLWFLPSCDTLLSWLKRCGFSNPRVVNTSITSTDEQRRTDWMQFQSLADFLDPTDTRKTVEGHPAPLRAIVLANKPG